MPELRLQVDPSILGSINAGLKSINGTQNELSANDIGREALAVYKWVVEQTSAGRAVVATDKDLSQLVQIATPNLPAKNPTL
jgi:hypothetical protein